MNSSKTRFRVPTASAVWLAAAVTIGCSAPVLGDSEQSSSAGTAKIGANVLPSFGNSGQWEMVNNAGPQITIGPQITPDINTFTGNVGRGDGRATDVTIQPLNPVHLVQGQRYQLSYDIKSDQLRDVLVFVQTVGKNQLNYFMLQKKHSIGIGWSHYNDEFTASRLNGRPVLVCFGIGAYEGEVTLQNADLKAIIPAWGKSPSHK